MNQANHSFREAASALAAKLQHADRTAGELTDELQLAHAIIGVLVRELTLEQKQLVGSILRSRKITDDGFTRHVEREQLIAQAKFFAEQNWGVQ
ncbi:hypothetical protein ASD15_22035 [Massilia sp. Root351]|jgi:ADP-ribosylglycohydrolase|uniref:hypothetical protein n=1 Tax=Massilia sp. Root351 TaxID=1736522 RepID=UPI00070A2194|nr:hypothetical protein [Massilia sp. Root351]KQV78495.1 hypothetical protein ASD15_22035 [Massilia sp. Root351]